MISDEHRIAPYSVIACVAEARGETDRHLKTEALFFIASPYLLPPSINFEN